MSIPKINTQVWLSYMKKTTIVNADEYGTEDILFGPEKVHLTGEFIIVARFGGHALHRLASRLANVIREGGR